MKKSLLLCLLAIGFIGMPAMAQSINKDSLLLQAAFRNSLQVYHNALYPQTSLYNGSRYAFFPFEFKEGQPFLDVADKNSSYIVVDQVRYDSISFLYDVIRQKIVVNNPVGDAIFLHNEIVNEFFQSGYRFIRVSKDTSSLSTGFYAVLHSGRLSLLQKRERTIRSSVTSEGELRFVEEKIRYYIKKDSLYLPADGRREVLSHFPEKRSDLQQFIRKEKLSFKKYNLEKSLVKLVKYYEQISH